MDALHDGADRVDRFSCNRDSLSSGRLCTVSAPHALEHLIRDPYARHFIRHELGIDEARERPYAGQHRNTARFNPSVQTFECRGIEHRTSDGKLSSRLDLVFEPSHFRIQTFSAGIDPDANVEGGGRADTLSAP